MEALDKRPEISLADQLHAVQDWWRDAGVDQMFHDAPEAMLSEQAEAKAKPAAKGGKARTSTEDTPEPAAPKIEVATLPATLEDFHSWWCDATSPLPGAQGQRIGPLGTIGARLMLLLPMPEAEDREALLTGPQGVLLRNILRALSLSEQHAYFASALPTHTPMPDWDGLTRADLGTIIRHHVTLAKPQRVLVFGGALAQMLGIEANKHSGTLAAEPAQIPLLATRAPEHLLANSRERARLWHRLLQWTPTP